VRPSISYLIVAWNNQDDFFVTLMALRAELEDGDEVIVIDNDSTDRTVEITASLAPTATVVRNEVNAGFAAGCNQAAALAGGDLLVFLNPDAAPLAGFGEAIRRPWLCGRDWAAWQPLIADKGGTRINSAGNPVHFTGIVWAGSHGQPVSAAPGPSEVAALSGACIAIPRQIWLTTDGFPERFFLYHDDVDLSLRLRLAGGRLGFEPAAKVDHNYEFGARDHKWRWLERNRLAFLIRIYPTRLLLLILPALIATEIALLEVSGRGGWGRQKLGSIVEVARWLPRLLRERRQIQSCRVVEPAEFAAWLTPDLDSPFFHGVVRWAPIRWSLRAYWAMVLRVLGGSNPGAHHPERDHEAGAAETL
jgi:GT2 family glycosyltransferase